mmetsp:Transcript_20898/g.52998  ORF Transcript_20898/g.52998 Transcript_20898/m.52998 type:complete len:220 (+) Transcript_20898:506-1165(+)
MSLQSLMPYRLGSTSRQTARIWSPLMSAGGSEVESSKRGTHSSDTILLSEGSDSPRIIPGESHRCSRASRSCSTRDGVCRRLCGCISTSLSRLPPTPTAAAEPKRPARARAKARARATRSCSDRHTRGGLRFDVGLGGCDATSGRCEPSSEAASCTASYASCTASHQPAQRPHHLPPRNRQHSAHASKRTRSSSCRARRVRLAAGAGPAPCSWPACACA